MHALYDKHIAARKNQYNHPQVEVFIDHFLKLNTMNKNDDASRIVNERDIRSVAMDLFSAGMVSTSKTLEMMLAILTNHPEVQDSVFHEIDEVMGTGKPKMEDRLSMPFTEAVILETLRYHSLLPFAAPHVNREDSMLEGYLIPAGTLIFPNLWALHHNERYWVKPWEFNPNRWLENGKVVPPDHIKKQQFLMFGAGRRQCPAEVFARNRLFILTTMMLQKFKFVPAEGYPRPNYDPSQFKMNILLESEPYKLSVKPRY